MLQLGISKLQQNPAILKTTKISEIIDKRAKKSLGFFISSEYETQVQQLINQLENKEKINKLQILKDCQELELAELGLDDGL